LANYWIEKGHEVIGTYRTKSEKTEKLEKKDIALKQCNLLNRASIIECSNWAKIRENWDVLVVGAGSQDPIGLFEEVDFDEWEKSLTENFIGQFRLIHELLPLRRKNSERKPVVLLFAGGGTNNAVVRYSAYTISKIASIKMCELLDAENEDVIFTIVGPGWVDTKIHRSTLKNKKNAGGNYQKTIEMIEGKKCFPIEKVVDCCDWLINAPKEIVGGRNFSAVHDPWNSKEIEKVSEDKNNFKLRRFANELLLK